MKHKSIEELQDIIFKPSGRTELKDFAVRGDLAELKIENIQFVRLVAIRRRFTRVSFKQCIFDSCYLRDSIFDTCDFTGARFIGSNLHGAKFTGCTFEYAGFERSLIDDSILKEGCPGHENLRMRFARALRMNYQQIGDTRSANKAVHIELEATGTHYYKAWRSNEYYYRKKYQGTARARMFAQWLGFKSMDFIWGNGESILKLLRFVFFTLIAVAWIDQSNSDSAASILGSAERAVQLFFGIQTPKAPPAIYLTFITIARLVTFGFFMSIIIKRFNRR